MQHLDLSFNQIENARFNDSDSCLSNLEILDLTDNSLTELPPSWLRQMPLLRVLNISRNGLTRVSSSMFFDISQLEKLDLSSNQLTSFELWLIQVKYLINYANNSVTHFSNDCNVDLSNLNSSITEVILFKDDQSGRSSEDEQQMIHITDAIFEMSNRCNETQSSTPESSKALLQMIDQITDQSAGLLDLNCSCDQFYIIEHIYRKFNNGDFNTYRCNKKQADDTYVNICQNRSSIAVENIIPRFCRIHADEPGNVPTFADFDLCHSDGVSYAILLVERPL